LETYLNCQSSSFIVKSEWTLESNSLPNIVGIDLEVFKSQVNIIESTTTSNGTNISNLMTFSLLMKGASSVSKFQDWFDYGFGHYSDDNGGNNKTGLWVKRRQTSWGERLQHDIACPRAQLTVSLPSLLNNNTSINWNDTSLVISIRNGEIDLSKIELNNIQDVNVTASNGKIELGKITSSTSVNGHVSNGEISMNNDINANKSISLQVNNGEIGVEDTSITISSKSISTNVNNGALRLGRVKPLSSLSSSSSYSAVAQVQNGELYINYLELPEGNGSVDLSTRNGQVEVNIADFSEVNQNSSRVKISLSTSNGEVDINEVIGFDGSFDLKCRGDGGTNIESVNPGRNISYTSWSQKHKAGRITKMGSNLPSINITMEVKNGDVNIGSI